MGTQGPGRKRIPNRDKLTAEDDALNQIVREAEARLAAKRAARAEAREIRMKELEKHQKEEDSERYSRPSRRHTSASDDEERMSVGSRSSFRVEDRPDRDFLDKASRTTSTLSAATLASLGGASSRRGSCDTSFSVETEASIRDIKDSLAEVEEKYRKAMVSNAQLHNEKTTLMYHVDTLREELNDMEEDLWEERRRCDHASKEYERERQSHNVLHFQFEGMKESLRNTEELLTEVSELRVRSRTLSQEVSDLQEALQWKDKRILALDRQREICDVVCVERNRLRHDVNELRLQLKKHGVDASPDTNTNGDAEQGGVTDDVVTQSASQLTQETAHGGRESGMLELRVKKLLEERQSLEDQVKHLKSQLDQKTSSSSLEGPQEGSVENGVDSHVLDLQRDANRQISELKFKLVKSEQEVAALEQNVIRLDGQVTRYRSSSEKSEAMEDELKVEKRKLQRELRTALDRVDELEVANGHLTKRLEKMKANRSALLAQQ